MYHRSDSDISVEMVTFDFANNSLVSNISKLSAVGDYHAVSLESSKLVGLYDRALRQPALQKEACQICFVAPTLLCRYCDNDRRGEVGS